MINPINLNKNDILICSDGYNADQKPITFKVRVLTINVTSVVCEMVDDSKLFANSKTFVIPDTHFKHWHVFKSMTPTTPALPPVVQNVIRTETKKITEHIYVEVYTNSWIDRWYNSYCERRGLDRQVDSTKYFRDTIIEE